MKQKSVEKNVQCLENLKKTNSKSHNLDVTDINIPPYLIDERFSKSERELLFRLRSQTIQVKEIFSNAYFNNDMLCDLCKLFPCTQSHILQCPELTPMFMVDTKLNISDAWIYGTVGQQLG